MDSDRLRSAPAIDTARLSLRGHRLADFADSAAMWADPEVTRFISGRPLSREEAWARVLRYVGHWSLMGFGHWVIREAGGWFVGEVGFADGQRDIEPGLGGAPEIGWALTPGAQGRGYGAEAVAAVLAWGERRFGGARTVCLIDPDNTASIRLAERNGYRRVAQAIHQDQPTLLFERLSPAEA